MAEGTATTAAPAGLGTEAVELLQRLIRANTVNPPGDERELQEELKGLLEQAGFECELLAAEPERPNLVARLRGEADGPTLTYLGHVDTVRADPDEWSRDPWSRRPRGRLGLGPRRAGHEGPGGLGAGRVPRARPLGLAAAARRAAAGPDRRRGGRRRPRRPLALRDASRQGAQRLRRQRGRRRRDRGRRPPALHAQPRREGRRPHPAEGQRACGSCVAAAGSETTRC